ncbi:hypothetical protein Bbelb_242990 [Branchiostoma belcheri]|nr:hypothetical protein Bbelb_242990 [Branchiostoma belcheri]
MVVGPTLLSYITVPTCHKFVSEDEQILFVSRNRWTLRASRQPSNIQQDAQGPPQAGAAAAPAPVDLAGDAQAPNQQCLSMAGLQDKMRTLRNYFEDVVRRVVQTDNLITVAPLDNLVTISGK